MPETLELPLSKEESNAEVDSNAGGGKKPSDQSSNSSSSDKSVKRPPSAADLKQLISLQAESDD